MVCAFLNPVIFQSSQPSAQRGSGDTASLLDVLAHASTRPRYAFMVLSLIAEVAGADGSAGPFVGGATLRDWLCDALTPMGGRDPRRLALAERVRDDMAREGRLSADPAAARAAVDDEVRDRVRASGKTNLSRAMSELVRAGLIRRHYQGYRVDHHNRGAQRHVVYTLIGQARFLLGRTAPHAPVPPPRKAGPAQGELMLR